MPKLYNLFCQSCDSPYGDCSHTNSECFDPLPPKDERGIILSWIQYFKLVHYAED